MNNWRRNRIVAGFKSRPPVANFDLAVIGENHEQILDKREPGIGGATWDGGDQKRRTKIGHPAPRVQPYGVRNPHLKLGRRR